jgi:hypothetical protein
MTDSGEEKASLLWLRKIEPEILEVVSAPGQSTRFTFPLDSFASLFSETLRLDNVEIAKGVAEWRMQDNFLSGLGKSPISFAVQLSPLEGSFFWVMSYEDASKLVSWIRDKENNPFQIDHPDLLKGIYRFIFLESLRITKHLHVFGDLSPKVLDGQKFDSIGYTIDISLKKGEETLWGRLIVPKTLQISFEDHFSIKRPSLKTLSDSCSLSIPLSISLGSVELSQMELNSLNEGDVVMLDNLYYKPKEEKGNFNMLLGDTPLFQIKYKEGKMKIFDFVHSYQENDYAR